MSTNELTGKIRELKELQRMAEEITAEMKTIKDEIKAAMTAQNTDTITAILSPFIFSHAHVIHPNARYLQLSPYYSISAASAFPRIRTIQCDALFQFLPAERKYYSHR